MTSNNPAGLMYLFQIVFALYMLVTTIVLINLLIAMMSDTYQRIQVRQYSLPCDEIFSHSLPCFAIAFIIPFSFNLHFRPNLTLNGSLDCRSWSGWLERELDNNICLYIVFDINIPEAYFSAIATKAWIYFGRDRPYIYAQLLISFLYQIKTAILLFFGIGSMQCPKNTYSACGRRLIPASVSRTLFSQGDAPEEHENLM